MKTLKNKFKNKYTYYSYHEIIESFEVEVLATETVGDYQGDYLVLLKDGDQYAFVTFGYGSCTVCDWLESCGTYEEVVEVQQTIWNGAIWRSYDEMVKYFKNKDFSTEYWYYYEDEAKEAVNNLKKALGIEE